MVFYDLLQLLRIYLTVFVLPGSYEAVTIQRFVEYASQRLALWTFFLPPS